METNQTLQNKLGFYPHIVPSHMDKYVSNPDYLLPEWIYNIMADKAADEYYDPDEPTIDTTSLTRGLVGITYQNGNVVCVPFRNWARKHAALLHIKRHFNTHHPIALTNIPAEWAQMESVSRS